MVATIVADRADFVGLPDERHLRLGELLAGVADHQHRVGVGQQAERRRQVRLPVTADAGGVDERQPVLEQRAGRGDLDPQHLAAAGLRARGAGRCVRSAVGISMPWGSAPSGRGDDQLRRRLLAVGHHGGEHGGLVVADAGHRHVQQRVEQLALALLELAGDHHPDLRIGDALPGRRQPLAPGRRGRCRSAILRGVVDQLDDDLHLARVIRLRHVCLCLRWRSVNGRRANWRGPETVPASCAIGLCGRSEHVDVARRVSTWVSSAGRCTELSSWLASTLPLAWPTWVASPRPNAECVVVVADGHRGVEATASTLLMSSPADWLLLSPVVAAWCSASAR